MTKTILVLGATGGIGSAVAQAMMARGWSVQALARDPARAAAAWSLPRQPHWIGGDAMARDAVVRAAAGASVILHAVNPPGYARWEDSVLPMMDNTIAAARAAGGARVVLPGTLYNYDASITPTIDEHTPQRATGKKGRIRIALEQRLADAAPAVPSLVVRAGDFFGPGARQSWFAQAVAKPPLRRIISPGTAGVGHAWAYLPDLAEAMAALIELGSPTLSPAERVQFAGFWDPDGRHMIAAVRRAASRPGLPVWPFPWWLMRLLSPFGGFPHEALEVRPFWRHPVQLDNARLVALLGSEPRTPLDVAVQRSLPSGTDTWPN